MALESIHNSQLKKNYHCLRLPAEEREKSRNKRNLPKAMKKPDLGKMRNQIVIVYTLKSETYKRDIIYFIQCSNLIPQ